MNNTTKRTIIILLLGLGLVNVHADEKVNAKLRALFPQFDSDKNHVLSLQEQTAAVEFVKIKHGTRWAEQVRKLFKSAAPENESISRDQWLKKVEEYGRQTAPPKQTFKIAMRDGIHLATDVFLPAGDGPFPVILSRTPYGRSNKHHSDTGANFTRDGYAYVIQDSRGRFDSEGESIPFIGCGWGEHQDGVDTLLWLRQQSWCNGKIGTIGGSAGGITQNLMAGATTNGLDAQYISVAAASLYHDAAYVGGAMRKCQVENWSANNKFDPKTIQLMRDHPCYDDYWHDYDSTRKFSVMNVPAVHIGGWFDTFAQGTIDEFTGRQYKGAEGARGRQKLVMGPWEHSGWRKEGTGELIFPNSRQPKTISYERWFEHYLQGIDNGIEKEPAVAYYVMGDTSKWRAPGNEWRYADDWPIPATETPFYFYCDGRLSVIQPVPADAITVEYTFNPTNACPTVGGNNLTIARGPRNQNMIETRKDVVLFTSHPLTKPMEVTGRVKARIFVDSSAVDTDLSVRLCDVYPDGKSYLMAEGMLRLRYRKSFEKTELLTPGKMEEVTIDCWSTSLVFNKNHRIRVTVTSSNYPRFDINPGTGQPWSETGEKVRQTNRIYCGGERSSCIILPVVSPKTGTNGRT
ncbi:MAG: CocE/NonD family hydrolase [Kiritimatiellae bacterium]|nr:CocE/NonD family hydrolase [Kiritimatiellia bacterium]MDD5521589.1 CocE/NonD family hydrolase [Kiritimatiellia bacterium]